MFVAGGGGGGEFEDGEGGVRADYAVEAEAEEYGGEDVGGDEEVGGLGEFGGGVGWHFFFRWRSVLVVFVG